MIIYYYYLYTANFIKIYKDFSFIRHILELTYKTDNLMLSDITFSTPYFKTFFIINLYFNIKVILALL